MFADGADTAEDNESDEGGEDKDETKLLVSQSGGKEGEDENFQDMIEMAATFQPTGNTLDTTRYGHSRNPILFAFDEKNQWFALRAKNWEVLFSFFSGIKVS